MNDADVTRLLDRVADEVPVREPPMDSLLTASRRALRRRRAATVLGLVAGVAVLAGGGLAASGVVSDDGHPPTAAPQNPTAGRTGALPDSGSGSCVEQYEPAAVDRRAFAFDGRGV